METVMVHDKEGEHMIEVNDWQYEVDFLKEDQEEECSAYEDAFHAAKASGLELCVVPCGEGVMAFKRDAAGILEAVAYMEENLDNFNDISIHVNPSFSESFEVFHLDLLLESLSSYGRTSSVKEFTWEAKVVACREIRNTSLS